jgi:hypothetical protein
MSLLFSPYASYFDAKGRPTAEGQELLARLNQILTTLESEFGGLNGIPAGGTSGQVLTKTTATDYDADWAPVAGATLADGDYGDITVSGSGTAMAIDAGAVTLAKQANVATATVFYRKTAGAGAPEVQSLATLKTDLDLTGTNSGDQTSIVGITGTLAQFNTALTGADFATGGGTATGTNTGDQNLFGTIAVSGQSDVVADSTSDTLTLAAGSNITITTSAGTDTITIAASGGGTMGTATLDFGAAPGGNVAVATVTGQAAILGTAKIKTWLQGDTSADFNAYEHAYVLPSAVGLAAANIVPGTGFDIVAATELRLAGEVTCRWEWSA